MYIVYQIKYKKVIAFKFSDFQYTSAINVKTRMRLLHARLLLSIIKLTFAVAVAEELVVLTI